MKRPALHLRDVKLDARGRVVLPKTKRSKTARRRAATPRAKAESRTCTRWERSGVDFTFPAITRGANGLGGNRWDTRVARAELKKETAEALAWLGRTPSVPFPLLVTITRVGPGRGDGVAMDTDGAAFAVKATRDVLAKWLGVDDADPCVEWRVLSAVGPYEVRVSIRHRRVCGACGQTRAVEDESTMSPRDGLVTAAKGEKR